MHHAISDMSITKLINNFIDMKNLKKFFFNELPLIEKNYRYIIYIRR
ncbi:hypothetical protein IMSAG192_01605 [Muribaculaceae bacterium]|jgi:hypothetical protein|nr:hypothetical protein IMSAG192_01605 [Muribaculaceae bacterium]